MKNFPQATSGAGGSKGSYFLLLTSYFLPPVIGHRLGMDQHPKQFRGLLL
jgi:hypothetical protein